MAHHPMGGAVPAGVTQGVLSGLAHPVIGADHLFFLMVAGLILSVLPGRRLLLAAAFASFSVIGILGGAGGIEIPRLELITAASVLGGAVVAVSGSAGPRWIVAFFAAAGLLHGLAYGEAVVGAENTALYAYLAGCCLVQVLVIMGAASVWRRWMEGREWIPRLKWAGFTMALAGVVLMSLAV